MATRPLIPDPLRCTRNPARGWHRLRLLPARGRRPTGSTSRTAPGHGQDPAREPAPPRRSAASSTENDVETLLAWRPGVPAEAEIPFMPSRVILQDFTGVPAVVDLAVMRDAMADLGGDPARVNPARARRPRHRPLGPGRPVRDARAPSPSTSIASTSATASATSSCAGRRPPSATCASCRPGRASSTRSTWSSSRRSSPIATTATAGRVAFPDTLVGTDSHTTMVNGLGVLGYGVGGIEAEAVLLGQPLYQPMPHVVGVRLHGALPRGLDRDRPRPGRDRAAPGPRRRRRVRRVRRRRAGRPVARRPGDDQQHEPRVRGDVDALPDRRRDAGVPAADRPLARAGGPRRGATPRPRACGASPAPGPAFDELLELDLGSVDPSVAGPRRPQDRVALTDLPRNFRTNFPNGLEGRSPTWPTHRRCPATVSWRTPRRRRSRPPIAPSFVGRRGNRRGPPGGRTGRSPIRRPRTGGPIARSRSRSAAGPSPSARAPSRSPRSRRARTRPTRRSWSAPACSPATPSRAACGRPDGQDVARAGLTAVTGYLEAAGLMAPLEALGFALAGYGCTTCIGNSGPLDDAVAERDRGQRPRRRRRPVGQPQLRGPDPSARAGELPRLAAARRGLRARRPRRYRPDDRAARAPASDGVPVFLADIWPSPDEIRSVIGDVDRSRALPADVRDGLRRRRSLASTADPGGRPLRLGRRLDVHRQAAVLRRSVAAAAGRAGRLDGRARPGRPGRFGDDRPHLAGRLDRPVVAGRPVAPGTWRRTARVQLVRRPARPPRGHDARHVRQHPAAQRSSPTVRKARTPSTCPTARLASSTTWRCATRPKASRWRSWRAASTAPARRATGRPRARRCSGSGPSSPRATNGSIARTSSGWASCRSSTCPATPPRRSA